MIETWRPVPGYEGLYEASDQGRIRNQKGHILSPWMRADGRRLCVTLHRSPHRVTAGVGAVVLSAFAGPRPHGLECCHNNGDPTDNTPGNLRWDTRSENSLDQVRHGTHAGAAKTHCVHGHLLPPDKRKRAQCPGCKQSDRQRARLQRAGAQR